MSAWQRRSAAVAGPALVGWLGALVLLIGPWAGCQFDRSGLSGKLECIDGRDCASDEVCLSGRCVEALPGDTGGDLVGLDAFPDAGDTAEDGQTNPSCPGAENGCGGCDDLGANPGDTCGGTCGTGVWTCSGQEALLCETEDADLNACGGCGVLDGEPGESCGPCDVWRCGADGESVICDLPDLNACGGCGDLEAVPGESCGPCSDGEWTCDGDDTAVSCLGAQPTNACGGCGALANQLGQPCEATCGTGEWTCASEESVSCVASDGTINACGGCETLAAAPGTACGDCGETVCAEDGESVSCDDPGFNGCGGCGLLAHEPGEACGGCGLDEYACDSGDPDANTTVCDGDTRVNTCGGCDALANQPGEACGRCGLDQYACDNTDASHDTTVCDGDTRVNACGGCGALAHQPGDACGRCGLDEYVCDDGDPNDNTTVCDGDTRVNACGGCLALLDEPGDACGPCSLDQYACDGSDPNDNTVSCDGTTYGNECGGCGALPDDVGDPCGPCGQDEYICDEADPDRNSTRCGGETYGNLCGGCVVFSEVPGTTCSCGGQGDAVWACAPDSESVSCSDGNNSILTALDLGDADEQTILTHNAWLDSASDIDVFYMDVTEDLPNQNITCDVELFRLPAGTGTELVTMTYQVYVFYRYADGRQGDIVPYTCGISDNCYRYDESAGSLSSTSCSTGSDGFDALADLYGCRETDQFQPYGYHVVIDAIDQNSGGNPDDTGRAYVVVLTTANGAPAGCERYNITLDFDP